MHAVEVKIPKAQSSHSFLHEPGYDFHSLHFTHTDIHLGAVLYQVYKSWEWLIAFASRYFSEIEGKNPLSLKMNVYAWNTDMTGKKYAVNYK